ncbi:unnamed protein product [Ixodes pacificus]
MCLQASCCFLLVQLCGGRSAILRGSCFWFGIAPLGRFADQWGHFSLTCPQEGFRGHVTQLRGDKKLKLPSVPVKWLP